VGTDIAAALVMRGRAAMRVVHADSQAAQLVAITQMARPAVVITVVAASAAVAADSTAVVVGSVAATAVAAADTGKHQSAKDRRKRLASASRFLLPVTWLL
jgi:hypothetical protein